MSKDKEKVFSPTPAQRNAIDVLDHTLLVSAAAGSGKTAVLTKKIIKLITDSEKAVNVSDLLVVTFTKAAASELRQRISDAIYKALRENPTDKHLSKQLMLLGKARISTIHSFCFDLIKKNFQILGLPSTLRLGDSSETALICNNKINDIIEECYSGLHKDLVEDFEEFSEMFLQGKTDNNLAPDFKSIYTYLCNVPEGMLLLKNSADELQRASEGNVLESPWGEVVLSELKRFYSYHRDLFIDACEAMAEDELFAKRVLENYKEYLKHTENVLWAIDTLSFEQIAKTIKDFAPSQMGSISKEDKNEISEFYDKKRNDYKANNEKIFKKYFSFSEDSVKKQFETLAKINKNLYSFLTYVKDEYYAEKIKRGILDYNDLERLTLKLLYDDEECTVPSEFSKTIRNRYSYIFIDEYQDVNELQDKIFSAISTPTNRFMVGDIKQSIYGFRGAEPTLFSDYRRKFPEYKKDANNPDGLTIFLSTNFRSDKPILDFANSVFDVLFKNNSQKTAYDPKSDSLIFPETSTPKNEFKPKICIAESDSAEVSNIELEAEYIANEIEKQIKSGKKGKDIAILLGTKKNSAIYEEALKRRGILSFNQENKGLFENDAVLLMLCLLNMIDNPSRDVYFTGAMKSPIFNFTLSEITEIKMHNRYSSMYDAVRKYASNNDCEKCKNMLETLERWRRFAEGCPVDKLIRYIYDETHIVELLSGSKYDNKGEERQANLLLLYEYARGFESGSFKGLYNFNLYLNDVLEKKTELANAKIASNGDDVVNIMTIHSSKGLEFDTVFLSDTSHQFNTNDDRKNFIIRKDLGLAMNLTDSTSFAKIKTFARNALEVLCKEDALDEYLRTLYVGLTRPKNQLIITSADKKARDKIEQLKMPNLKVCQYILMRGMSMFDHLIWGVMKSDTSLCDIEYVKNLDECKIAEDETETLDEISIDRNTVEEYKSILRKKLDYQYTDEALTKIPTKLSVSKLHPGILDELSTELSLSVPTMYNKPRFLSTEQTGATGAERGTATHVFMQFCDFVRTACNGVDAELETLKTKGFIDERNAELVNKEKVEKFFKSDLYSQIKDAKNVWREKRFNIKLPASDFVESDAEKERLSSESVLVQGVIDLLFETPDGKLVLADYKTDYFSEKDIESGLAEQQLIERHKTQLSYYAEACKRLLNKPIDSIVIYSFALDNTVKIL